MKQMLLPYRTVNGFGIMDDLRWVAYETETASTQKLSMAEAEWERLGTRHRNQTETGNGWMGESRETGIPQPAGGPGQSKMTGRR